MNFFQHSIYEWKAANKCLHHTKIGLNIEFVSTFSVAKNGGWNSFVPSVVWNIPLVAQLNETLLLEGRGSSSAENTKCDAATTSIAATASPYRVDRHWYSFSLFGLCRNIDYQTTLWFVQHHLGLNSFSLALKSFDTHLGVYGQ